MVKSSFPDFNLLYGSFSCTALLIKTNFPIAKASAGNAGVWHCNNGDIVFSNATTHVEACSIEGICHGGTKSKKKELAEAIVKQGKYDIVIFNEDCTKIKHVIEVKKLKESYIFPEGVERHRGLEDIYELSDFIEPKKFQKNTKGKNNFEHDSPNIHQECRGYNLMFICKEWAKPKDKEKYEKMKIFLDDIKKAYEEAKIYYLAIGIDEVIIENPNGISLKFEDLRCGEGTKYSTIS